MHTSCANIQNHDYFKWLWLILAFHVCFARCRNMHASNNWSDNSLNYCIIIRNIKRTHSIQTIWKFNMLSSTPAHSFIIVKPSSRNCFGLYMCASIFHSSLNAFFFCNPLHCGENVLFDFQLYITMIPNFIKVLVPVGNWNPFQVINILLSVSIWIILRLLCLPKTLYRAFVVVPILLLFSCCYYYYY